MITPNYIFNNPAIQRLPPQRDYFPVECRGEKNGPFTFRLTSAPMDDIRYNFRKRRMDLPPVEGNWGNMQVWIDNMWEALFNPVWLLVLREEAGRKYAIIDGVHRLRLLDAMDATRVWFYEANYPGYATHAWRITSADLPPVTRSLVQQNRCTPRWGSRRGTCVHCGTETTWKKKTVNRLSDIRMYCRACGEENPYPYPGML